MAGCAGAYILDDDLSTGPCSSMRSGLPGQCTKNNRRGPCHSQGRTYIRMSGGASPSPPPTTALLLLLIVPRGTKGQVFSSGVAYFPLGASETCLCGRRLPFYWVLHALARYGSSHKCSCGPFGAAGIKSRVGGGGMKVLNVAIGSRHFAVFGPLPSTCQVQHFRFR